jgi:imidazolonepropionase
MIKLYTHLNEILTLAGAQLKDGRRLKAQDLSLIQDGAIVFDEAEIHWVGKTAELPEVYSKLPSLNLQEHVLTPEIVDSHSHIVFGGDRAQEYARRLNGVPYEQIAKEGGGILYTMKETNAARPDQLFQLAKERIERLHSLGVGTIEIKSGYGLNFHYEFELTQIIHRLKQHFAPKVQIFNTYLAAHDVPRDFESSAHYLDEVVLPLFDKVAGEGIIDAIDIFHEKNYFSTDDCQKLFSRAHALNIPIKIHADELNDNDGARLAVSFKALSADHLLKVSAAGIQALAESATVATLLPGTAFFLGKPLAPARQLLDAGAKVALASDFNPGSCHCDNLLLIASIAAPQLKLNQAELWAGITLNAAHALGLSQQGALIPGMKPRFALFKADSLAHITYHWGKNLAVKAE